MLGRSRKLVRLVFMLAILCMVYLGANSPYVNSEMPSLLQGGLFENNMDTARHPNIYSGNQENENVQTEQQENQQQQQQQQEATPNANPTPASPFNAVQLIGPQSSGRRIKEVVERHDSVPEKVCSLPAITFPRPPLVSQAGDDAPHVVINARGRLGNQMCQYLSVYLLRHLFGVRVSVKQSMKNVMSQYFLNVTIPVRSQKNTKSIPYASLYGLLYDAAMREVRNNSERKVQGPLLNTSYYVYDYPCPPHLFMRHRELFRSVLVFKDELLENAKNNMDKALDHLNKQNIYQALARLNMKNITQTVDRLNIRQTGDRLDKENTAQDSDRLRKMNVAQTLAHRNLTLRDSTLVTVHVRRTDFIHYIKQHYNFTALDHLYYQRAFDFFRQRVESPVFVVVSDDLEWCRENLSADDVVIAGSPNAAVDQALLTLGDHTITSYGTFSFIGAVLAGGHFTHPISLKNSTKYTVYHCVRSMDVHYINRDED